MITKAQFDERVRKMIADMAYVPPENHEESYIAIVNYSMRYGFCNAMELVRQDILESDETAVLEKIRKYLLGATEFK